jgi:hypothetical protein
MYVLIDLGSCDFFHDALECLLTLSFLSKFFWDRGNLVRPTQVAELACNGNHAFCALQWRSAVPVLAGHEAGLGSRPAAF